MSISSRRILALLGVSLLALNAHAQSSANPGKPLARASLPAVATGGARPDSLTVAYSGDLWPKVVGVATVYYAIDASSDSNATAKIDTAIQTFNADFKNVIQWVLWNSSSPQQPYYVDINLSASDTSGECEANEGFENIPAQPMTGSTNCTIGTILHEMGHVIGLWHEQSRPDAVPNYISINYKNVIKGSWSNFQGNPQDEEILGPYDYASVMQYIPYAFTRNGGAVIETVPPGIPLSSYEGVPAEAGAGGEPALPVFDYSAGDKETILRLYGAAPTQVTVTSNPVGLSVIVDGVTITTPQTYSWALYSTHTLDVSTDVQTLSGYILNSNPPVAATFYYTYGRWSDVSSWSQGAGQSHTITVTPGNGSPAFPVKSPAVATYSANFVELVPYNLSTYPADTGTATVSPQPQNLTVANVPGQYFVARQQATLSASAATVDGALWNFYSFNNGPFWLQGGLGANPKTFYVPDTGDPVDTIAYFSNTPIYTVDVVPETFSSNFSAVVDGDFWYTPKNFSAYYDSTWIKKSTHSLSVAALQYPYSYASRYSFLHWSDGGAIAHSIASLPAIATDYKATVQPQFEPAINFGYPPCGGTAEISPQSPTNDGFYPSGQKLTFSATPSSNSPPVTNGDWFFAGWTYDLTGAANPKTLTASDETLVFANFNSVAAPLTLTRITPASVPAGSAGFTLTLTGTGFTHRSIVSVNGTYPVVTFVKATTLTVRVTSADVAAPGAFQVYVENFPSGWTGCAVFGYQTFLVQGKGPPTATPMFSLKAGGYSSAQTVSISDAVPGTTIYYTTDGTTPTNSSSVYANPITVSSTETLKADAVASGYVRSAVASAVYTIEPLTAAPKFSPKAGSYSAAQTVSISDATSDATIYYTTDGTAPTTSSSVYGPPLTVSSTETLKAFAVATGHLHSGQVSATYTIESP